MVFDLTGNSTISYRLFQDIRILFVRFARNFSSLILPSAEARLARANSPVLGEQYLKDRSTDALGCAVRGNKQPAVLTHDAVGDREPEPGAV